MQTHVRALAWVWFERVWLASDAFFPSSGPSILGNVGMVNKNVVFNLTAKNVGFAPGTCPTVNSKGQALGSSVTQDDYTPKIVNSGDDPR